MKKAILFDLDGTLTKSDECIINGASMKIRTPFRRVYNQI